MRRLFDMAIAIGFSAALIAAGLLYKSDLDQRGPSRHHIAAFGLEQRHPDVVRSVDYALSADWAADLVADSTLRDELDGVDLTNLTPEEREAWIESASHASEALQSARELLLDAIAVRPGWAFHQSLLGQLVLAANQLDYNTNAVDTPALWLRPLLNAAAGAPAVPGIWQSLAAGYLQTWPALARERDSAMQHVLTNAFADPEFVRVAFAPTAAVVGRDLAIRCLPDSAKPLLAAYEYFSKINDIPAAVSLQARWQRAEWNERVRDLSEIERHFARGDADDVRSLCRVWVQGHSVWDFDSPAAHAQAARLLELWSGGSFDGGWGADPFAEIARYLWTRNGETAQYAAFIGRIIDAVPRVPKPVLAEIKLAAGDAAEAQRLAQSADDAGSLEWSRYLLALTRKQIASGNLNDAEETLRRMPPAVLQTHEALLTRGELADARAKKRDQDAFDSPAPEQSTRPWCAADAKIPVHGSRGWQTVRMRFRAAAPTIIDLGANDARAATLLIPNDPVVTFRFFGFADQTLWFKRVSGGSEVCVQFDRPM